MPVGKWFFPFLGKNELFIFFLKYESARFSLIDVVFDKDW